MKKISIKILATILVAILMVANFGFLSTVLAANYPYSGSTYEWENPFYPDFQYQCTWYAWGRFAEVTGCKLPNLGNAYQWYDNAPAENKSQTLQEHSIIVIDRNGYSPYFGHVVYIEAITDGVVYVSEGNYDGYGNANGFHEGTKTIESCTVGNNYYGGDGRVLGYIVAPAPQPPADTEAPVINNVTVSEKNSEGLTITADVSDNVGVTKVSFYVTINGQEKVFNAPSISDGKASVRINYADYGLTEGTSTATANIWAYDDAGNTSNTGNIGTVNIDLDAPVISNVKVTNVTGTSYTLTFEVDDNVGVTKVQCPTWNEDNDRDEMEGIDWGTDPAYTAIEKAGVYTYTVNIDNDTFKNEGGEYRTQITAYDEYGNVTKEDINVDVYPVTDVTLNETEKTIYKGQELVLEATYEPIYTTGDTEIVWTSSDEEVATVEDGVVTALKEGTTTITAEVDGVKATCEITVEEIPLEGIAIEEQNVSLNIGEEKDLHVLFNPESTTDDKTVVWTSSDESVITISEDGKVKALKAGKATITATVGDKTATTEITVNEEVTETEESNSVLPKTGDMQVVALAIGMLVSILGIAFIIKKNRK